MTPHGYIAVNAVHGNSSEGNAVADNAARRPAPDEKVAAARLSLYSNIFLTGIKLAAGLLSGSVSVLSEAAHSASDLLASSIALVSVRVANLPPDEEHPYGHGKAESLSTLAEAVLLLFAAAWIIYEAITRLVAGAGPRRLGWGIAVMAISAVVNLLVVRTMFRVARQTDSLALHADAENHRADIYTAAGVLAGLVLVRITRRSLFDPILAIGVSMLIVRAAWRLIWGALGPLMDTKLPRSDVDRVRKVLDSEPGVLGYHRLRTRKSGSVRHVDAHVQMDDDMTLREAHDLTERVEDRIRQELPNTEVTLHTEPYRAELRHQHENHGGPPPGNG